MSQLIQSFSLQVFFTWTYSANQHILQKRLTGASSTIRPTSYAGLGGRNSTEQNLKLYTSPPLTERTQYHKSLVKNVMLNDQNGGKNSNTGYSSANHNHNHNHDHQNSHDHTHYNSQDIRPETSNHQIEQPKIINSRRTETTKTSKDTTERYNRDIAPISSSRNRIVPAAINSTSSRKSKGRLTVSFCFLLYILNITKYVKASVVAAVHKSDDQSNERTNKVRVKVLINLVLGLNNLGPGYNKPVVK